MAKCLRAEFGETSLARSAAFFYGIREESAGVSAVVQRLERELTDARAKISWLVNVNEELESVNEELYTVNAECHQKLAELTALREDHDNRLEALPIGVVFMNEQLIVRRFNGEAARALLLQPERVGSSLTEVAGSPEHAHLVRRSRDRLGATGSTLFANTDAAGLQPAPASSARTG